MRPGIAGFICTHKEGRKIDALKEVTQLFQEYCLDKLDSSASGEREVTAASLAAEDALEAELAELRKSKLGGHHFRFDHTPVRGTSFLEVVAAPAAASTSGAPVEASVEGGTCQSESSDSEAEADEGDLGTERRPSSSTAVEGEEGQKVVVAEADADEGEPPFDVLWLAETLFEGLVRENLARTRFIYRCIPVQKTCRARLKHIERALDRWLPQILPQNRMSPYRYEIRVKVNNNGSINKKDIFALIEERIPACNVVDLRAPQFTIMVTVLQNVACISIVRSLHQYSGFNFNSLGVERQKPQHAKAPSTSSGASTSLPKPPST